MLIEMEDVQEGMWHQQQTSQSCAKDNNEDRMAESQETKSGDRGRGSGRGRNR